MADLSGGGGSSGLRAQVESVARQFTVGAVDASGTVTLEPELSVQEAMARQIGQLWEEHGGFQGLSDSETDEPEAAAAAAAAAPAAADLDAYAVRAKVHEQLLLAQSEVQVSLDIVRLLLAAKKQAARTAALALQGSALVKHDQPQDAGLGFAARVGDAGTEVTVGGVAFPITILGTARVDAGAAAHGQAQQQELRRRREEELRFVLGAKHRQLADAADTLERSAARLRAMTGAESRFWRTAFELRARNWVVLHHRQVAADADAAAAAPRAAQWLADRYFVPFGCHDAGAPAADDALAELLRDEPDDPADIVDAEPGSAADAGLPQAVPLFVPGDGRRGITVALAAAAAAAGQQSAGTVLGQAGPRVAADANASRSLGAYDRLHRRLLDAQSTAYDRELYHRLCREARVLELGAMRTADGPLIRDMLATTLSRDAEAVRLEWALRDLDAASDDPDAESSDPDVEMADDAPPAADFARWQGQYYAGLARVMAALFQRRVHRAAADFQQGHGLPSRAQTAASVRGPLPGPFAGAPAVADAAGGDNPAAAVASRPELLTLAPVLQRIQFARWQHLVADAIAGACGAWRRLVDEPIEVVSHLVRTHRQPTTAAGLTRAEDRALRRFSADGRAPAVCRSDSAAAAADAEVLAFVVRMRFPGGTVMAFWLSSLGHMYYVKGFCPPQPTVPPAEATERAQELTRRVFRVVPLGAAADFADQLRRELQALALLRVAAALSAGPGHAAAAPTAAGAFAAPGRWRVHQSQMCVIGEWRRGSRAQQIIGVAKWAAAGWSLALFFAPKHPTGGPDPASYPGPADGPWVACYPPPAPAHGRPQRFEARLSELLAAAF
ncbi:hypothetical protein H4R21_002995 [Coemansia helicoidea]|uniref:Uncharacterized protein n=1 Tax=Coemansia helicoidea TaxID=1286919 RepID=A0ACC1L474_9FUNG|nr:hypothetical protein H4R21_002995 [Coemansia helicoidea]